MGPPAPRRMVSENGGAEAVPSQGAANGVPVPRRTASGNLQRSSCAPGSVAFVRGVTGGGAKPAAAAASLGSGGSQRSSGSSQASLLPDAPGERIAAITLVEVTNIASAVCVHLRCK